MLKSRDPHLAGGEKQTKHPRFFQLPASSCYQAARYDHSMLTPMPVLCAMHQQSEQQITVGFPVPCVASHGRFAHHSSGTSTNLEEPEFFVD